MAYTIRAATVADADFLPEVERSAGTLFQRSNDSSLAILAYDEPTTSEQHIEYIQKWQSLSEGEGGTFLAVHHNSESSQDVIVGFISTQLLQGKHGSDDRLLYIAELSVHADHQRRGLASKLVHRVLDVAVKNKFSGVTLTTMRDLPYNKGFYEKSGFQEIDSHRVLTGAFGEDAAKKWRQELDDFSRKGDGSLAPRRCWMIWKNASTSGLYTPQKSSR